MMTTDSLIALILFAVVASITPGPNNIMLMASGANFGVKRTLPHMWGVVLGFVFLMIVVGSGLARLFDSFPLIYSSMRVVGIVYLLYLSWKIATAASIDSPPLTEEARTDSTGELVQSNSSPASTPFTFLQAATFQWVNPKVWIMGFTALSVYAPNQTTQQIAIVVLIFGLVTIPSIVIWVVVGQQLRRWLDVPKRLRAFNVAMALLLVGSLYPVLSDMLKSGRSLESFSTDAE